MKKNREESGLKRYTGVCVEGIFCYIPPNKYKYKCQLTVYIVYTAASLWIYSNFLEKKVNKCSTLLSKKESFTKQMAVHLLGAFTCSFFTFYLVSDASTSSYLIVPPTQILETLLAASSVSVLVILVGYLLTLTSINFARCQMTTLLDCSPVRFIVNDPQEARCRAISFRFR